jgi:hypothetical protein
VKKAWREELKDSAMRMMAMVPGEITGFHQTDSKRYSVYHAILSKANVEYSNRSFWSLLLSYDSDAAVMITWYSNQWVSFDDGVTMNQKMDAANELIWSMDVITAIWMA